MDKSKTLIITGNNVFDAQARYDALQKITKNLSTKELTNVASLCDNPKAKQYFGNDMKFTMLKKLL